MRVICDKCDGETFGINLDKIVELVCCTCFNKIELEARPKEKWQ